MLAPKLVVEGSTNALGQVDYVNFSDFPPRCLPAGFSEAVLGPKPSGSFLLQHLRPFFFRTFPFKVINARHISAHPRLFLLYHPILACPGIFSSAPDNVQHIRLKFTSGHHA